MKKEVIIASLKRADALYKELGTLPVTELNSKTLLLFTNISEEYLAEDFNTDKNSVGWWNAKHSTYFEIKNDTLWVHKNGNPRYAIDLSWLYIDKIDINETLKALL